MSALGAAAGKAETKAYAERVLGYFELRGAQRVEAELLQPAEDLLDLYGEDIRARAYVTQDPVRGEMMLRPDFTLPVLRRHMEEGGTPVRYCYAGEVFRMRSAADPRPVEAVQIGYEIFTDRNALDADAELFATIKSALDGRGGLRAIWGDKAILTAAISALETTQMRKAALRRHVMRPARFHALLERFAAPVPARPGLDRAQVPSGDINGTRQAWEIAERLDALRADQDAAPIPKEQVQMVKALLALDGRSADVIVRLREIAEQFANPDLLAALAQLQARIDAFSRCGVSVDDIIFQTHYTHTPLEYYDGFVFSFLNRADHVVATGGRYDALTRLFGGDGIQAAGAVIKPEELF